MIERKKQFVILFLILLALLTAAGLIYFSQKSGKENQSATEQKPHQTIPPAIIRDLTKPVPAQNQTEEKPKKIPQTILQNLTQPQSASPSPKKNQTAIPDDIIKNLTSPPKTQ